MIERSKLEILKKRIYEPRRFIQVITGPRQTGKTTMVNQLINTIKIPYIFESADAIPISDALWLSNVWETARKKIEISDASEGLLIIDEVQKVNNWSEIIKRLWDEDTRRNVKLKVILLGSSRLLVQQGLTESLAGRFEIIYLGHWTLSEMEKAFGWNAEQFAWFGGYPGSASLIDDEKRWKDYILNSLVEATISKDIIMLTRVDKPALMKRLFNLGCAYSGQIISFTKIMGNLQDAGNTTTLTHYLELLNASGLLGGIKKYSGSVIHKRSSIPKFQVYNNALLSTTKADTLKEIIAKPAEWGRIVESAIGSHLLNAATEENFSVYYWRERDFEVDFVIEKKGKLVAIEVKTSVAGSKKGMSRFILKNSNCRPLLVSKNGLSWQEFLKINPVELF